MVDIYFVMLRECWPAASSPSARTFHLKKLDRFSFIEEKEKLESEILDSFTLVPAYKRIEVICTIVRWDKLLFGLISLICESNLIGSHLRRTAKWLANQFINSSRAIIVLTQLQNYILKKKWTQPIKG